VVVQGGGHSGPGSGSGLYHGSGGEGLAFSSEVRITGLR